MPRKLQARFGGRRIAKVSTPVDCHCDCIRTSKRKPAETENLASRPSPAHSPIRESESLSHLMLHISRHPEPSNMEPLNMEPSNIKSKLMGGRLHAGVRSRFPVTRTVSDGFSGLRCRGLFLHHSRPQHGEKLPQPFDMRLSMQAPSRDSRPSPPPQRRRSHSRRLPRPLLARPPGTQTPSSL